MTLIGNALTFIGLWIVIGLIIVISSYKDTIKEIDL